jgi:hypothetical protein
MAVSKASGKISIDGKLDDAGWKDAAFVDRFVERYPGENIEPDVQTNVMITYDEDKLYVAYKCYDDPGAIRATMCQRDQFYGDDAVYLLIDTYGDASWAYELFVNPYGIQKDLLWTRISGEDVGFDFVWESAGQLTDWGYQVEIALPFANMRFPNKESQTWKTDFWRYRPRETSKTYSWAAYDRNQQCWPCQWGAINGIKNIHPGSKGINLMPSLVASQFGYLEGDSLGHRFINDKAKAELSLGGKYTISSDITAEVAINPDFSQIEADAAQIDVNTTIALIYPERRPYFQEGSDLFRTIFNSFYTRTINNPEFTAKATVRKEGFSAGFLTAADKNTPYMFPLDESSELFDSGRSLVNILRALKTFGNNSQVGLFFSDRRFEKNGAGTVFAVDDNIRLTEHYSIDGQYIFTYTKEPKDLGLTAQYEGITFADGKHTAVFDGESYWGSALISRFKRNGRNLNFTFDFNQVSPSYRTETGYDPLVNYRHLAFYGGYDIYISKGIFERITPDWYSERRVTWSGAKRREYTNIGVSAQTKIAQTYFYANYKVGSEIWINQEFNNLWTFEFGLGSTISNQLGYSFEIDFGQDIGRMELVKGNYVSFFSGMTLKPIDRLVIEPNINYLKATQIRTGEELFKGHIARVRTQFQATRESSFRLVVQYNDFYKNWDIDPLFTYRLSPFSVFYVGSSHDYGRISFINNEPGKWRQTARQLFMKIQYLFQT